MFMCYDVDNIIHYFGKRHAHELWLLRSAIRNQLFKYIEYDSEDNNIYFTSYSILNQYITDIPFPKFPDKFYKNVSQYIKLQIIEKNPRLYFPSKEWKNRLE